MTPGEFKAARLSLGLSGKSLAAMLGYARPGSIYDIEAGDKIPGPVAIAMRAIMLWGDPAQWRDTPAP